MLINNVAVYEPGYKIELNSPGNPFFYYFDYDERSYEINMEFQHFHQFYELCIFLEFDAGHIIEGNWFNLQCCDIVAIRPSVLHKTQYPKGKPNKRLIIQFAIPTNIPGLEAYYEKVLSIFNAPVPFYRFEGQYRRNVFNALNEVYYLSKTPNDLTPLAIHNKFMEFLSLIYQYQKKNIYVNESPLDNTVSKIYDITSYIHNHFQENLSLTLLSKQFFISSYYLSHQFKHITGFTLTDYIQMARIRNAQSLLLSTNSGISEIAFQCGFTSFSQFNRVFNKYLHMSPSVFRKTNQMKQA